jgi:hypothetical protein
MDCFVAMKWAEHKGGDNYRYFVKHRKKPFETILRHQASEQVKDELRSEKKRAKKIQLQLFPVNQRKRDRDRK